MLILTNFTQMSDWDFSGALGLVVNCAPEFDIKLSHQPMLTEVNRKMHRLLNQTGLKAS